MTKATTNVARVAAAVAGLGLVASAFAPLAFAQTATTTTTTTTTSATFTRDLTLGSTGADVTALQNWLIAKGHAIPAGATGYFGAQTKAALAAYQAANGITPAAGYFGPITRAKVAAAGGSSTTTTGGTTTTTTTLSGGEADLSDYDLRREDSTVDEAEEEVEIATAEFDVEDGDVEVQRVEVEFQAASTTLSVRPWDYIESVSILDADGDELASMDVDSRSDWDENDDDSDHSASTADYYTLTFTGLDYVVEEGETAELTVAVTGASSIDSDDLDQTFRLTVADDGIRALDAEGIQQYVGENSDFVSFGFGEEESGDLRIRSNSDDPESTTLVADEDDESDEYTVFVFDIDNEEDVDTVVTDVTIDIDSSTNGGDFIRSATLVVDGDEIDGDINNDDLSFEDVDLEVAGDESVTLELRITLVRDAANTTVQFSIDSDGVEAEGVDSGDEAEVGGTASSEEHTVAQTGVVATAEEASNRSSNEADSSVNDNGTGTFRLTFSVEAIEEDAYIYRGAAQGDGDSLPFSSIASTTGFAYNIYQGSTATTTLTNSATVQSAADTDGDYYIVREGDSEEFTVTITADTAVAGSYYVELDGIRFDTQIDVGTSDDTLYLVPDRVEFESEALSLY